MAEPVLALDELTVRFLLRRGELTAVDGVSFSVHRGETFGLVGESGSGKSVTARSIMRLIPDPPGEIPRGRIVYEGQDVLKLSDADMRALRGRGIAMVFQEPMSALNPVFTVCAQISDALCTNLGLSRREARERVVELLALVGIPSPRKRLDSYVHEFSGGMRQRVMLAMALSCNPNFLIADEPTTALDVTIQATILELITGMIDRFGMSMIFITHNLGVVAHACDTIGVMYASHMVELGAAREIFRNPQHPYTIGLLELDPSAGHAGQVPDADHRHDVQHDGATVGLQIPSPLRARHGHLQARDSGAARDRARTSRGVPPAWTRVMP